MYSSGLDWRQGGLQYQEVAFTVCWNWAVVVNASTCLPKPPPPQPINTPGENTSADTKVVIGVVVTLVLITAIVCLWWRFGDAVRRKCGPTFEDEDRLTGGETEMQSSGRGKGGRGKSKSAAASEASDSASAVVGERDDDDSFMRRMKRYPTNDSQQPSVSDDGRVIIPDEFGTGTPRGSATAGAADAGSGLGGVLSTAQPLPQHQGHTKSVEFRHAMKSDVRDIALDMGDQPLPSDVRNRLESNAVRRPIDAVAFTLQDPAPAAPVEAHAVRPSLRGTVASRATVSGLSEENVADAQARRNMKRLDDEKQSWFSKPELRGEEPRG